MQDKRKRLSLWGVLIIIILASLSFMVIPAWIPFLRKGWVLLIIASAIIVINWRKYISPQAFLALVIYGIVVILNSLIGDAYFESWTSAIYEFLVLFVPSSLALYCTKSQDNKFVSVLVKVTIIALVFEMIASYLVMNTNEGIVRGLYLRSQNEGGLDFIYSYFRLGILDYFMGHAVPILIAPLFCLYKESSRINKTICFFLILVCVVLTWMTESATAILLMLLMLLLGLIVNQNRTFKTNIIVVSITMLIAAGIMSNVVMSGVFDYLIALLGDDSILGERLAELQLSLYEDQLTGDLEARVDLYNKSMDSLSGVNLLFGSNAMPGRHSGFLDRFAVLGLVGFVPLLFFLYYSLKSIWDSLPDNRSIYFLQCILAAFLLLFFKGAWVWPLFFILYIVTPSLLVIKPHK